VYHIDSQYHAYQEGGMLVVEGSTIPENIFSVLELVLLELWQLGTSEKMVDKDELWRAKMHIRGQHLIDSEDTNTCMSRLATQELYFGRHISPDEILTQIEAVDEQALVDLSQDMILSGLSKITIALVGPDAPEHYSKESIEELLASLR
jgi:predicted Zn-dependent peptidase